MDNVFGRLEKSATAFNLNTPLARFAFVGALATAAVWMVQPAAMFYHGQPRPFAAWSWGTEGSEYQPTRTPWWMAPAAMATVAATVL